jgi:hypothetical protein
MGSIPFAFFGASIPIEKDLFELLLFVILVTAGILLFVKNKSFKDNEIRINQIPKVLSIIIGSVIGFISGVVGIGGGIFLSPILFLLKADKPKNIITTASLFILINSISGIIGQLTKENVFNEIVLYWPLFLCVLIGGFFGNFLNLKIFSNRLLALATSLLVIFIAARMGLKILI